MEFTKITPQMLAEIRGLAEEVIPGPEIHDDFCHDELAGIHCRPEVLVRARSTEEVSRVMKYAYEHHVPVTPRGQGTGLVGGSVAPLAVGVCVCAVVKKCIELQFLPIELPL